ncbi:MAG: hypothetical protein V3W10_06965, partial [candidate division NC10 bacterium]
PPAPTDRERDPVSTSDRSRRYPSDHETRLWGPDRSLSGLTQNMVLKISPVKAAPANNKALTPPRTEA